ncbi:MAG: purine-nucleoside phosphorylase [Candidatus Eiseniibacteriota bacterium]
MSGVTHETKSDLRREIDEAVRSLRGRTPMTPEVAVILGTGLGSLSESLKVETRVPYSEIPHFAASTVEGHRGELVFGRLGGRPAVVMSGRVHYYEGYSMRQVSFPVRVLQALGARTLIVSNACGGMNPLYDAGDIMIVVDHINLMGDNPLIGPNDETLGPRFPDMSEPYDRTLIRLAESVALEQGLAAQKGVYVAVAGPNLETAAEYRFLRGIGADVVGMSLVPETLVAVHGGLRVLAFSVVTDRCWPDALEPVDIPKILAVAARVAPRLDRLVTRVVERLDEAPPRPRVSPE